MAPLRAGAMGSSLATGVPSVYADSLAARIEREFNVALAVDGLEPLDLATNAREARDRRRLFVAIARGVLGYLADNDDSLTVKVTSSVKRQVDVAVDDVPPGGSP